GTGWSAWASRARRSIMVDLRDAPRVAPTFEPGLEPPVEDLHPLLLAHEPRRQHQHVGVVVLARQLGDLRAPGDRGPHAREPIGDVGHAEPRPAGEDAAARATEAHGLGD